MISANALRWGQPIVRSRSGAALLRLMLGSPAGPYILRIIAAESDPLMRRLLVGKAMSMLTARKRARLFARLARHARKSRNMALTEVYWLAAAYTPVTAAQYDLFDAFSQTLVAERRSNTNLLFASATAAYETARYKDAVAAYSAIRSLTPHELMIGYNYLKAAHAAGNIRENFLATEFFARQFYLSDASYAIDEKQQFEKWIFQQTLTSAFDELQKNKHQGKGKRIGIFFLSSTQALGHAILDPYYFLALHRTRYDSLIFIGPARAAYRPASRICLEIVEQYGRYVETGNDALLNLSWMSMGTLKQQPIELTHEPFTSTPGTFGRWYRTETVELGAIDIVIEHYWSLLREAVYRTRDDSDPFHHNAWHMKLPEHFTLSGEAFCLRHGIDLAKPLVVLHAREDNYHAIEKQSFRNTNIKHYVPAVHYLLDAGYQVVRIGDRGMARLRIKRSGYFELPSMPDYQHQLDPFLISRSVFMIGSQSGPCSYARALGTPLLSINAVLHYTLLPAKMEMACFKRYVRSEGLNDEVLTLESALAAGAYHFDSSVQFKRAGIYLEQATSDEILASVKDMIAWLKRPDLPETELQVRFKDAVERTAQELVCRGSNLDLPIGDFIGISLPGYRISPTVAVMREEEMTVSKPRNRQR